MPASMSVSRLVLDIIQGVFHWILHLFLYSPVTISYLKRWVQFWELYSTRRQGSACPLPSLALPSSSPASKSSSSPRCPPWPPATPPHLLSLRPPWQFSPSPQYSLVWQRQRQGLIASALWRQLSCFYHFQNLKIFSHPGNPLPLPLHQPGLADHQDRPGLPRHVPLLRPCHPFLWMAV